MLYHIAAGACLLERKEKTVVGAALAVVIYALALSMLGPVMSLSQANRTVSNAGSIKGIGVGIYQNQNCTTAVSSIDWGILDPGANATKTVYIRNEGNSAATLSMATSNWSPSNASSHISLNWNYAGQNLTVSQVIPVVFTLSVSSSISGITNFSFDITVTAVG